MSPAIIVAVILFVGVLVFVHEMGHFLAAKLFDVKVTKFSLGF
ncbi:MAG: site-2 protease family protein, partial [Myxococcota bacterium]